MNWGRPSAALVVALALSAGVATAPRAQEIPGVEGSESWSWDHLARVAGVDSARLDWLRQNLDREEADLLFDRVRRLSDPTAAQLLPARFHADPSFHMRRTWYGGLDTLVELLSERPPPGEAGLVQVAYAIERIRRTVRREIREPDASTPEPLELDTDSPSERLRLRLDFRPARRLLRILEAREGDAAEIDRIVADPVFEALCAHRSQSFYPMAVTREVLAENLRLAASDRPIDALYRYAFPIGLMHFADVRNRAEYYLALVDTLSRRSTDIAALISGRLGPYVPAGTRVDRTVHFLFADGADGWAAGGVAAIDLEYFGDDYERLIRLLAHESYHAVQAAVRDTTLADRPRSPADSAYLETLDAIFREGTATHLAPPREPSSAEYERLVQEGVELLEGIHAALFVAGVPDVETAARLSGEGMRNSGPLYWLGAEIARRIEKRLGQDRLVATLHGGGIPFFATYLEARVGEDGNPPLIDGESVETVRRLTQEYPGS